MYNQKKEMSPLAKFLLLLRINAAFQSKKRKKNDVKPTM